VANAAQTKKSTILPAGKEMEQYAIPIELDPNIAQEKGLCRFMGARRKAWNTALGWVRAKVVRGTQFDLINHYNKVKAVELPWWAEVSKHCFESAFGDLTQAFANHAKNPSHFGAPTFKRRDDEQGCKLREGISISGRKVKLPKLGKVRYKEKAFSIPAGEKVLSVTLAKKAGRYYASILVERVVDAKPLPAPEDVIFKGADSGIKAALTVFDGTSFSSMNAPRPLKKRAKSLKHAQRALSRKKKGSSNRKKAKAKVGRITHQIAQERRSFQHSVSKEISHDTQDGKPVVIGVEDANWKGMLKNHKLAGALSDVGISGTISLLDYKATKYGGMLIKVGRFFPSSKMCSRCSHVKEKLGLGERTYRCEACGLVMDRDENAAVNIRNETIRIYREIHHSHTSLTPESGEACHSACTASTTPAKSLQSVRALLRKQNSNGTRKDARKGVSKQEVMKGTTPENGRGKARIGDAKLYTYFLTDPTIS